MTSVLTSFISIQLKSTTRCRYTVAAPGGRHRQLIFNGCRLPALEELGTTWNTVWWLNRVVRNQLGETFGIKVTGSNSSLLSAGSRSSEGIKYCFGSQKLLFPISVIQWQCDAYTDTSISRNTSQWNKEKQGSLIHLHMIKGLDVKPCTTQRWLCETRISVADDQMYKMSVDTLVLVFKLANSG